jgi:hypothetical protein
MSLLLSEILEEETDTADYRGWHAPPSPDGGAPLYDVTANGIYPKDFYSVDGLRWYGDGRPEDSQVIHLIQRYKGRPDQPIKIFRAVPKQYKISMVQDQIDDLEAQKKIHTQDRKITQKSCNSTKS